VRNEEVCIIHSSAVSSLSIMATSAVVAYRIYISTIKLERLCVCGTDYYQ